MPAADGYVLSAEQIKMIERMLYQSNRIYKNRPLGALGDDAVDHEEYPSPEVYVARTPEEGIPGFDSQTDSDIGTGAFPHTAVCYIYKVDFRNGHMEYAGFTQIVTNLSAVDIEGDKWILTLRDKFGTWYAIDILSSRSGFPARTTAGYEVTSGYPWERTILNEDGTFSAHPSGQSGDYAYCPDENTELPAFTDGWLFPNPDSIGTDTGTSTSTAYTDTYNTWIFIPVYRTRTTCEEGELAFQISTDGGDTWVTLEFLGVECNPHVGTGETYPNAGGGGGCTLARLQTTDCLLANGPENSIQLEYSGGHWISVSSPGDTSVSELTYFDGLCSGVVEFWYESGRVHLTVGGIELLQCGNNCFTGGPLTGHFPCDTGTGTGTVEACQGEIFTVCVSCRECMYWYCVATQGECEGTGTGTRTPVIEILELTVSEAEELGDLICDGPFYSEDEALAECGVVSTLCCPGADFPSVLTLRMQHIDSTPAGSCTLTYNTDTEIWEGGGTFTPMGCPIQSILWQFRCHFTESGTFEVTHSCNGGTDWNTWTVMGNDCIDFTLNQSDYGLIIGTDGDNCADCFAVNIFIEP